MITLTKGQQNGIQNFQNFLENDFKVFILKGYAGTGKTTLISEFIKILEEKKIAYKLLASTGRAAKILSNITNKAVSTIHSEIYRFTDFNKDIDEVIRKKGQVGIEASGQLLLNFALSKIDSSVQTVYIIDEASMISDTEDKNTTQAMFGSGKLLSDLLEYDQTGKFVFVGDECQLPPVVGVEQDAFSPALSEVYFRKNLYIYSQTHVINEIVRQLAQNDIIAASKKVRELAQNPPQKKWGDIPFLGYNNINLYSIRDQFIESYYHSIEDQDYMKATMICRSNKKCNEIANFIRNRYGYSSYISEGDLLLVTQNNHITGLMNGDMVVVKQILEYPLYRANLTFRKIEVEELVTKRKYTQLVIENIINENHTNLSSTQQTDSFVDFFMRMKKRNIKQKSEEFNSMMMKDPYLNALRAVYGYALTCHKSQGGEWEDVFVDIPRNFTLDPKKETYQWLYTAITRTKSKLHMVNEFYMK